MLTSLKDKIIFFINNEDKKAPLTDEQLAVNLSVLRESITCTRKKLNIPNSRYRKKEAIKKIIDKILNDNPDINISGIVKKLKEENIILPRNYINNIITNSKNKTEITNSTAEDISLLETNDVFNSLIGYDGSLVKNIKQGQAAILYPPLGLPTLIVGESGTGKTLFAESMYKFAIKEKIIVQDAPFILFNCADYSDNPQLLVSMLFGYKKGSFTGADKDTPGLVEAANNGFLFLDEVHRLPPKGQEMLFSILDRGKFRRMGEIDNERSTNIYFIAATTENIESSLLLTFRRRIPMIIELPTLEERSLHEKISLIHVFFQEEANRTNYKILVNAKIMEAFAFKKYLGNIGQLKSELQVTCANAYVNKINNKREEIYIGFNEILYQKFFYDINLPQNNLRFKDTLFIPNVNKKNSLAIIKSQYSLPEDIYKIIENKYYELKESNMPAEEAEQIIWNFLLTCFDKIRIDSKNQYLSSLDELKYILDNTIIEIMKDFTNVLKKSYPNWQINERVLIYLAIHLEEAIKRIYSEQEIMNPNLIYIKKNFNCEFNLASKLAKILSTKKRLEIPEGEIGFIAIYIHELLNMQNKKNHIAIITISHGKVASELINVVKKMLNVDFPIAIDMPLDVNPVKIFEEVIELTKTLKDKKEILFFVDMGSLVNIGEIVHNRTGINTRTIDRVDLLSVLEAVRKADASDESLNDIYYDIINSKHNYPLLSVEHSNKTPAFIAICITGYGIAIKIKKILEEYYFGTKIITLSITDENLKLKISNIKQQYNLLAIIGTINPQIEGINFIAYDNNFAKDKRMFLDYLLKENSNNFTNSMIRENFIIMGLDCSSKKDVIETIGKALFNEGLVLFEYINSVLEREKMNSTYFRNNAAIPHGLPSFVKKSTIVFVQLKNAISWDKNNNSVKLICLPAIKSDDGSAVSALFKILKNKKVVDNLLNASSKNEFMELIKKNYS